MDYCSTVEKMQNLLGNKWVITDDEIITGYARESTSESYGLVCPGPEGECILVKPDSSEEVAEIMKYACEKGIAVIPKGAGTSLSANAIPERPGLILSLERMNDIVEIDRDNMMITCQAGVTLGQLLEELAGSDIYFPLHPGDEGAQVGGMTSMNAGGVRAVRHGVMQDQVVGFEAVLPTGEIESFGGSEKKLLKDNSGYNLKDLLIGSEGTLAVITEVTLKLYPEPDFNGTLIVSFASRLEAFEAETEIRKRGIIPLAVEYVEKKQIEMAARDIGKSWPASEGEAYLMIMLAEDSEDDFYRKAADIQKLEDEFEINGISVADTTREEEEILEIRSHILPAIQEEIVDSPDVTVPPANLPDYLQILEELENEYNTELPVVAHAGDGNLHVLMLKEEGGKPAYFEELKKKIYREAVDLGGTITGEHGIGRLRLDYLPLQISSRQLEIMWGIKQVFDPENILNPGKKIKEFNKD